VVFLPTSVSVDVGSVNVPAPFVIDAITGVVKVGDEANTILPVPVAPVEVTPSTVK